MLDGFGERTVVEVEFLGPLSFFGGRRWPMHPPSNSNRPGGHADHPFGYNPRAVAEAERLAVEAMYLGADILETLKHVDRDLKGELVEETAKLAKTLMFWGVGAATLVEKSI